MLTSFKLDDIKVLHIEPTTVCQAACPQCDRENPALYTKDNQSELLLEDIKRIVPTDFIKQLDKMFMCGNFGEPAAAKESLEIFQYFKEVNPNITLGLNTNGGVKNPRWWTELAKTFNGVFDYVVFSLDGLEDLNHVYRKNVNWNRVMDNASAYINAGGSAHWDMLVYRHNQHQVNEAQDLAKQMGFTWFRAKVSKRFEAIPIAYLNPPEGWQLPNVENPDEILCHALEEGSIFLAATGEYLPCCFMGSRLFNRDYEVDRALKSPDWQAVIDSWQHKPLSVCTENCGITKSSSTGSSFENQWKREVQLS